MKDKDYHSYIAKTEEKSAKLKKQVDRETSSEDRILNMANRVKRLRENE